MRGKLDFELQLKRIPLQFKTKSDFATAEGNNAAWICICGELLVGRSYFQFGDTCYTKCPNCQRRYRVNPDSKKKAFDVVEF
ncbi:hypothetical protein EHQ42_10640 [Leptospira levettii]|uniref:hypothetical protein n=1 Tax=Leptospira levettii TaxID=2023178 RepID=UPI001083B84E|nr:hypothetical protein [Leptospira levettii]TGL16856.1 hypothetical protein EHQ42_10640 [Leptospira levettii]